LIFHRFSVWLWREFLLVCPVAAMSKNFAAQRKQGDFTLVCRFWANRERQIPNLRLSEPKVWAVKIAKPKDVNYEK
jgi:hypothetical protein